MADIAASGLACYLAAQALALCAWPVAFAFFRRLPDRGYAFSKALGLLAGGFLHWSGWAFGLLPNSPPGAWTALAALGLAGAWAAARVRTSTGDSAFGWIGAHRVAVLSAEAVFLAVFAGWLLVRARDPGANHTEQPMDLMLLNALRASRDFPPPDAWFSGHAVAYYYFGSWLVSFLGHLSLQPADTAYNLGQCAWFALLALTAFGLGRNLLALARPDRPALAAAAGVATALAVAFAGNVRGLLDAVGPGRPNWWWAASRASSDPAAGGGATPLITEFPFFSFYLGDNHAHVLSAPFLLLTAAFALALFLEPASAPAGGAFRRAVARAPLGGAGVGLAALAAGALWPLNTWDLPAGFALLAAAHPSPWTRRGLLERCAFACLLAAAIAALFAPYAATSRAAFAGFALNRTWTTSWREAAMVFGGFLPGVLLWPALPRELRRHRAALFAGGAALFGALLALVPEAVVARDVFGTRMNTVFKFYYQAWPLLALASVATAALALTDRRLAWAGALALLAALAGLAYPARVLGEHAARRRDAPASLSASRDLARSSPDEFRAIEWLRRHTPADAVVAEAPGRSYVASTSRASTFSGRATPLGWAGHEAQWRGPDSGPALAAREDALRALYAARSEAEAAAVMAAWDVDYVYVGPEERRRYGFPPHGRDPLSDVLDAAFRSGDAAIYRRAGARTPAGPP
jgi:uncharacterized membrane protein